MGFGVGLAVVGAKLGLELGWFDGSCVGGTVGFGVGLAVVGAKLGLTLGWFDGSCVGGTVGFGVGLAVVGVNEGLLLGFLDGDVVEPGKATLVYFVSMTSKAIFWSKHSQAMARLSPPPPSLYRASIKYSVPFSRVMGLDFWVAYFFQSRGPAHAVIQAILTLLIGFMLLLRYSSPSSSLAI